MSGGDVLARVRSAAVLGIDAYVVEVETDIVKGLPSFATVGLPHGAVKEGRERVNAAITNSGLEFPLKRITVNLAPADVRKEGSAFDLPIAVGILAATDQLNGAGGESGAAGLPRLDDFIVVGELGLEGDVRPIRGALCIAAGARHAAVKGVIVPKANMAEASVVRGWTYWAPNRRRASSSFLGQACRSPALPETPPWRRFLPSATRWILRTCEDRNMPNAPSRLPRQALTMFSWSDRLVQGRRCWLAASPRFSRR